MRRFINSKLRRMAHSAEEGQALLIWSGFGLTLSLWAMIFGIFLPSAQRF